MLTHELSQVIGEVKIEIVAPIALDRGPFQALTKGLRLFNRVQIHRTLIAPGKDTNEPVVGKAGERKGVDVFEVNEEESLGHSLENGFGQVRAFGATMKAESSTRETAQIFL